MPHVFLRRRGFTLIELMIVVSVIATLAAVAVPKMANALRKAKEGQTKGNVGRIRSALSIYYADMEGQYPTCAYGGPDNQVLDNSLVPKYINKIPTSHTANYHFPSKSVWCYVDNNWTIEYHGIWAYAGTYEDWACKPPPDGGDWCQKRGEIWMFCYHTDTRGDRWDRF